MKKLIILRGPSGSGKSTLANHLSAGVVSVFEADKYFAYDHDYKFDVDQLGNAHNWCRMGVERQMFHRVELVIVSNTSTTKWEMKPYLELADKYDYEVEIIRTPGPWDAAVLFERNIHNVPLATLEKQINRYKPHEDETEWTDMSIFS